MSKKDGIVGLMVFLRVPVCAGTIREKSLDIILKHHVRGFQKDAEMSKMAERNWKMARFFKRRKGGNGHKHKPHCSVHKGVIHGKVYYWHRQPMCLNCRRRFSTIEVKKPDNRGLIARIFNW